MSVGNGPIHRDVIQLEKHLESANRQQKTHTDAATKKQEFAQVLQIEQNATQQIRRHIESSRVQRVNQGAIRQRRAKVHSGDDDTMAEESLGTATFSADKLHRMQESVFGA